MNKQEVIDLIKDAGYCCFATTEGKQPRVRPMSPYLTEDSQLLMALFSQLRTVKQVKENPMVELCFVDRKMCFARISGKAKLSDNADKKQIVWDNEPMLKQYFSGVDDPNFTLLEIGIEDVEVMTPQQMQPEKVAF